MMIKKISTYLFFMFTLNIVFVGCTKEVDFNQVNDFEVSPVLESSMFFFDASAADFFVGGAEISIVQDFIFLDIFNSSFLNKNLVKTEFVLESINNINRDYEVRIDFLNNSDQLQHTFTVLAPESSSNLDVVTSHTELLEGDSLQALKRTTKIVFTVSMLPGSVIDDNTLGRIRLESKGVFYFNYER